VNRREFIAGLGNAVAWPMVARAQQQSMPIIGMLSATSPAVSAPYWAGLRQGLNDAGYVEGKNIAFEPRWADGHYDRLPSLAAELVRRPVDVIVPGGIPTVLAASAATSIIPIVFTSAGDPVQLGIVASFNRPGGNITGVSFVTVEAASKRLELLRELVPRAAGFGLLENPANPRADPERTELQTAARAMGKQLLIVQASSERDFDAAFAALAERGVGGLLVPGEPLFILRRQELLALAARYAVPAIYDYREFAADGGLLSYGFSLTDTYRLLATQVARILKGAKPAELPVLQPTKFELIIDLKTAKALGLTIPETLLALADEVIE
jgi:putative tryptophan/tyrosine transport system substrate-binding protein